MNLVRLLGKLRPAVIASLYICSLLFVLPSILRNLDRPGTRLAKSSMAQGTTHFAIADFDGDLRPDTATIRVAQDSSQAAEYFLELHLSSGSRPAIGILGPAGGLQITPQDVNGDKIADLVITSPFDAHFVAILLNDGKGNFKQVETSDYLGVGKRPNSRLFSHDDAAFPRTLGQNRSKDGNSLEPARREGVIQNWPKADGLPKLSARSFAVLSTADRAPPLV